jgi:hypothetical protein
MVVSVVEWFACRGWWPLGWLATLWASLNARRSLSGFAARVHTHTLVDVLAHGRDPVARWHAQWILGRLWTRSPEHRQYIWPYIWSRFSPPWRSPFSDRPPEEPEQDLSYALTRFLLGADSSTTQVPSVRLVGGMPLGDATRAAGHVVVLFHSAGSDRVRVLLADLLTRTGEPHLLAALERAFEAALEPGRLGYVRGPLDDFAVPPLWEGPDDTPSDLLNVLLTNPYLPRPPADGDPDGDLLAVLAVLKDRPDLLDQYDERRLVSRLLHFLFSAREGRTPAYRTARTLLCTLGPGPGREEICRLAMHVDAASTAVGVLAEAARIATEAGYRPADPAAEPLFLVMTDQWEQFRTLDPGGRRLRAYGLGPGEGAQYRVHHLLDMLDKSWRVAADGAVTAACRAMLGDIRDGPTADLLYEKAARGSGTAIAVVTSSGLVPADEDRIPAFLFMTRQWRRYEATDPGGHRLRAYIAELDPHDRERDRLRDAARAGGRPEPCEPAWPSWATTSPHGSGGGHGVTGSGGYSSPGGGFSVHGV